MDKCLENKRKEEVRLNKYISDTGFCSRREADKLIEENRVKVDGIKATMGSKVFRHDAPRRSDSYTGLFFL